MTRLTITKSLMIGVISLGVFGVPKVFADDKSLTVVSWGGDYQQAQTKVLFSPFHNESGVDIKQDTWGGELAKIRAMVDTDNVTWDLIAADESHAIAGCAEGILEPIQYDKLGNLDDFPAKARLKCGIQTDAISMIFAFDTAKFPGGSPHSLSDIFDTKKFPGKRGLRKQPKYLFEQVLIADGVAPADVYKILATPEGVDRVFKKLDTIKNDIIWWTANAQAGQLLVDGEVSIVEIYNGRFYLAESGTKKDLGTIWDGQVYAGDTWIIPKGAKVSLAHDLLKFIVQPKVLADLSNIVPYGSLRPSSGQYVDDRMKPYLSTTPENMKTAVSSDEMFWADNEELFREKLEAWLSR